MCGTKAPELRIINSDSVELFNGSEIFRCISRLRELVNREEKLQLVIVIKL